MFLIQLAEANPGLGITGVDNDASRIELARDRLSKRNMGNVKVLVQDALKLEFTDASFESVVCINVFFNLSSQEVLKKVLKEIARVTAPGGSLVFDFRNSLNPLLRLKYGLARFYDATVKDLPLKTYSRSKIPVIMLTAVDTNEAKEKSLGLYHEDYIIKPFKTDSLVAKIKDVLSRKA